MGGLHQKHGCLVAPDGGIRTEAAAAAARRDAASADLSDVVVKEVIRRARRRSPPGRALSCASRGTKYRAPSATTRVPGGPDVKVTKRPERPVIVPPAILQSKVGCRRAGRTPSVQERPEEATDRRKRCLGVSEGTVTSALAWFVDGHPLVSATVRRYLRRVGRARQWRARLRVAQAVRPEPTGRKARRNRRAAWRIA